MQKIPLAFFLSRSTERPKARPLFCPTVPRFLVFLGIHGGCGMGNSAGRSVFAGNQVPRELPPYCLGHIGYSVVPWKRQRGYATRALQIVAPEARSEGLAYVELISDADNIASQRVIEANGGELIERFHKSAENGGAEESAFPYSSCECHGVNT